MTETIFAIRVRILDDKSRTGGQEGQRGQGSKQSVPSVPTEMSECSIAAHGSTLLALQQKIASA